MMLVKKTFFIIMALLGFASISSAQVHAIFDDGVVCESEGSNGGNMAGIKD